jgi:hypothetical protein
MTTSNTFSFNPAFGDFVVNAYAKCGIRRTDLTAQHMSDAVNEANFMMSDWAGDGINLWQVERATLDLVAGQISYSLPATVVFLLDVYTSNTGSDRIIIPISRTDYASLAQKDQEGQPTSYWFDRTLNPTLYLWPIVPQSAVGGLVYYYMQQSEDIASQNGTQLPIPTYFFDAFVWGLAARLSYMYAPEKTQLLQPRSDRAWSRANQVGTENVPLTLNIAMRSYFG